MTKRKKKSDFMLIFKNKLHFNVIEQDDYVFQKKKEVNLKLII